MSNQQEIAEKLEEFSAIDSVMVSDDNHVVWGYIKQEDSLLYGREMSELQDITSRVSVSHQEHFTMLMCYAEDY